MATIHDLIEVTSILPNTTYSEINGNLLGSVEDGVTSIDLDDGEFDVGDALTIGGVTYTIDTIQKPAGAGTFTLGDDSTQGFGPGSESNLDVVFLTVSNGGDVRYFVIPNDSYGDLNVQSIQTGTLSDAVANDAAVISTADNNVIVVCFADGTRIRTPGGDKAVEHIGVGDLVITRDHGAQPVRAIVARSLAFGPGSDRLKPIVFEMDALGPGCPDTRLCVSPQHRMLVRDGLGRHVLAPAKALVGRKGVRVKRGARRVTYYHLVFERHEIVLSNGTYSESFFPGPMALEALSPGLRRRMARILGPDLEAVPYAATCLTMRDAQRHVPCREGVAA